jgi:hypothetical protein
MLWYYLIKNRFKSSSMFDSKDIHASLDQNELFLTSELKKHPTNIIDSADSHLAETCTGTHRRRMVRYLEIYRILCSTIWIRFRILRPIIRQLIRITEKKVSTRNLRHGTGYLSR